LTTSVAAVTLKELARLLGLSATTVSRALNNYPEVGAATRLRVLEAATRHGYAPNQSARRLATGRAMAIGHVLPLGGAHEMINPLFAEFIAGAGEVYSAAGYDMLLSLVPEAEQATAYRLMAAQRRVDGVMVHSPLVQDPRLGILREVGLPFVVHGRDGSDHPDYAFLDINNRRAFRRATEFLIDLGHRRIALLNGLEAMSFAHRRRRGFEEALAGRGLRAEPSLMRSEEMTELYGHRSAREMLALPRPPTAFLVASIIVAIGVLRAVREAGLEPGRDVSIVTHDDELAAFAPGPTVPVFTATRCSIRAAGRRCAELLIARIGAPSLPPAQEVWDAELTLGQSTGRPPRERRHAP
jgi:LacI family transcriptional regulator